MIKKINGKVTKCKIINEYEAANNYQERHLEFGYEDIIEYYTVYDYYVFYLFLEIEFIFLGKKQKLFFQNIWLNKHYEV